MVDHFSGSALVLGAGAWGTALASHWADRAPVGRVRLWARDASLLVHLRQDRENKKYLPSISLSRGLEFDHDLAGSLIRWRNAVRASGEPGLLVLATPVSGLSETARAVAQVLGAKSLPGEGLLWLSKGLLTRGDGLLWPSDLVSDALPHWPSAVLTGPSFAQEVAQGLPCALSLASQDYDFARQAARQCHGGSMRVYASNDLVGAQLGGAMKNVLAIAAGVADGLALGANARAALITRGLAETARLGLALGAKPKTFMGLSTLGDLVLTATGDLSRNRRVGLGLAQGHCIADILKSLGHVAEGVPTAPAMVALATKVGVEVPIAQAVSQLLTTTVSAAEVLKALLSRDPVDESD